MPRHYSAPKGFVGRNICYAVTFDSQYFGHIVAGSATRLLPGRPSHPLNNIVNNTFFHIEKGDGYPVRNFAQKVLTLFEILVPSDWFNKYGDRVTMFESLVELPRKGEVYLRCKWRLVGQTKGYTCKRIAGESSDSWTGKRVWDTKNLRPKLVFVKELVQSTP